MRRVPLALIVMTAALALPPVLGCRAAPRVRPILLGSVDTGPTSVEGVRRQLQGTWELTALEVLSPAGEQVAARASGRLEYDQYGNLSMQGTISDGPVVEASVLNIRGRVIIDPRQRTLKFEDIEARTADAARIDPKLDASLIRYYEFSDDLLRTAVRGADGTTTAVATWRKIR